MITPTMTLLVQPSRYPQRLLFLGILTSYFILCMALILSTPNDKFDSRTLFLLSPDHFSIIPFVIGLILIFGMAYAILFVNFLTPNGYLLLTPDGFIAHSWRKNRHQRYRWHEVSHFYVAEIRAVDERTRRSPAFDLLYVPVGNQKQKLLSNLYSKFPQRVVDNLNQWRDNYSLAISDGHISALEPVKLSKKEIWTPWTIFAQALWLVLLLIVIYFAGQKIYLSLI